MAFSPALLWGVSCLLSLSHLFSPSSNLVIWVVSEERAAFFFFSKITTTFSPQAQATPYGHFWVGFLRKKNASFSHG